MLLEIEDLYAQTVDGTPILKGFTLKIRAGEIHAIMGPNGTGKSTLAKVLAGHPEYEVTQGSIFFDGQNLLEMEPCQRAQAGLFMGFQYPPEIPGVGNELFLRHASNAIRLQKGEKEWGESEFRAFLEKKMKEVEAPEFYLKRNINEGFSGGEKKRNEILQLAVLDPLCAILDETDSGLDIDAIRIVSQGVHHWMQKNKALILITHYQRLLDYIQPHFVHVMADGKIQKTGDHTLAHILEKEGYDPLISKLKPSKLKLIGASK